MLSKVQRIADAQSLRKRYLSGMDATPLRIVIIESHPLMREALCAAIASEPGLKLVAETTNGSGSLSRVTTLHPDVILFSLGDPGQATWKR